MTTSSSTPPAILVPLDGSALAEKAIGPAVEITRRTGGRLILLTVPQLYGMDVGYYTSTFYQHETLVPMPELIQEARDASRTYLDDQAAKLSAGGLSVQTVMDDDVPPEAVVRVARESGAALVVLASHGYGGLTRWAYGSVAEKVLQTADTPLLLIRSGAEHLQARYDKILVALDGSPAAEAVLPDVEMLAKAFGATVVLAHVTVELATPLGELMGMEEARQHYAARLAGYLAGVTGRLERAGVKVESEVLQSEDAAEGLIARANQHDIDLVAMTTHGRGGLSRWAFGSVADKVLRAAETPVLVRRLKELPE